MDRLADSATGDMAVVQDQLTLLSSASDLESAYAQLDPVVNAGVTQGSFLYVGEALAVTENHLLGIMPSGGITGISSGDEEQNSDVWVKGFGTYAEQDNRNGIHGYAAVVWGAMGGIGAFLSEHLHVGMGAGYGFTDVDTEGSPGGTDIDSIHGITYAGYKKGPWYLNGLFDFTWHEYEGSRRIQFGAIDRTAASDYSGQSYSGLITSGYEFVLGAVNLTPLLSLRYTHLDIESYTESGAGSLNLHVSRQSYDLLQSGIGLKLSQTYEKKTGKYTPEIRAQWLYDFIGDEMATTSSFSGGGGSFRTNGFETEKHSLNVGAGLTFYGHGPVSINVNYDFELKEDYWSHTGTATVKYHF